MHFPAKQKTSSAEDVRDLVLDDGSILHFCPKFTYLGSIFTLDLDDSEDVQNRLNKANSAFGSMRALVFSNPYIPLPLKRALYTSLVVNLLLWGCENWALREESLRKLQTFHTKCCRAMIGVSMWEVAMYSVTNENVLKYVGVPPMENIIHHRRLTWMGKIARMPFERFPRKFLAAWTVCPSGETYSRPHGRRQKSTRDSFLDSLKQINLESTNGQLESWVPEAKEENEWKARCDKLLTVEKISYIAFLNSYL